jgi:hypothetical protein
LASGVGLSGSPLTFNATAVPEPCMLILLGTGLLGLLAYAWRRRRS